VISPLRRVIACAPESLLDKAPDRCGPEFHALAFAPLIELGAKAFRQRNGDGLIDGIRLARAAGATFWFHCIFIARRHEFIYMDSRRIGYDSLGAGRSTDCPPRCHRARLAGADLFLVAVAVKSMARPRIYHEDRPATDAEYKRASRARVRARQKTGQETRVRKPVRKPVTKPQPVAATKAIIDLDGAPRISVEDHQLLMSWGAKARNAGRSAFSFIAEKHGRDSGLMTAYRRASPGALIIEGWISDVREWGGQEWDTTPDGPREEVYGLIKDTGPLRAWRIGELFDHLKNQLTWKDRRLLDHLREQRAWMLEHPHDFPRLRITSLARRREAGRDAIIKLFSKNSERLWTLSQIARNLRTTVPKIRPLITGMLRNSEIKKYDKGRGLLGLPGLAIKVKPSASQLLVDLLIAAPDHRMSFVALRASVKAAINSAIDRAIHTLRQIGVLQPADPSRRAPIELSTNVLTQIKLHFTIRDSRGGILWEPERPRFYAVGGQHE
jgi:hypothetical protein